MVRHDVFQLTSKLPDAVWVKGMLKAGEEHLENVEAITERGKLQLGTQRIEVDGCFPKLLYLTTAVF